MTAVRSLAIGLLLVFGLSSEAAAHCTGQPGAGLICGNNTATSTFPDWFTMTSLLDRNFGAPSVQGTVLNRGASLWSATAAPSLGKNGGTGGSIILNGSSTGSATIGVNAAAGSVTFNLPITNGTVNQVLITDGSGNTSWTTAGAGTVSSVGLSLPSIITVTGSPVTGAGTLTGTLATQSANLVWAGPTTGAASAPTFRSLVGADLPNPSSSSLGGVQSFAAVGSQWIRQISTLGVPTASQPAFTDISGTLAAAQCPNPSASTIGCVESYAVVPHQWINTISTSGIPSSTQPNFTDLSGNATLSQFPSISSSSVLGNNSGGTSVPSALSASNVLDFIATTQGDVLYRDASSWVALSPGTNGQVLTSSGAAANPTWTTVTGTGTVTSIATNNGVTGGTITTTGTIGLATIATGNALAYTGAGSGVPVATTPSALLDVIGSTTGDILYRSSGSGWQVLAPGTNGQVLTQGASTPAWGSAGTVSTVSTSGILTGGPITTSGTLGVNATLHPQGRLTLTTGVPVLTTTVSGAATVYYTPYHGNLVPIYDGTNFIPTAFAEVSQATTDATKSPAAVGASKVYDIFCWVDTGPTNRCTRGPAWTNDTTRGYSLAFVGGIYLNNSSITNGPASQRGTWVGTIRSNSGSTIDWIYGSVGTTTQAGTLYVWNLYERVLVNSAFGDSTASWTYNSTTWRQIRAQAADQISIVTGLSEDNISVSYNAGASTSTGSFCGIGIGVNSTSSPSVSTISAGSPGAPVPYQIEYTGVPGIGVTTYVPLEATASGTGCTYYGSGIGGGLVAQQLTTMRFRM